jgi:hypothetical protein
MTAGSRTRLNGLLILLTVPGHCPARPPHPRTGARGRVPQRRMLGRLAPVPPARQASCSPGPPPWPSPRTCPSPPPRPGKPAGQRADAGTCTLSSAANVKPHTGPPPRTLVRGSSVVAVPVRGRPCKADGPPHGSLAPIPVRYASVDPATQRSTALQGDTRRDREKRPASNENSQLAGRISR